MYQNTRAFHKIFSFAIVAMVVMGCTKHGESEKHSPHWDYENPDWKASGYSDCGGSIQTPIDIVTSRTVNANLDSVVFDYAPFTMKIIDNGHTVQVNKSGSTAAKMTIDGVSYDFLQFHYHTKSEHAIDGNLNDMEIHLVHQDPATKALAVVGVMCTDDVSTSPEHPFIKKYKDAFPTEKYKEVATATNIDLDDILPVNRQYYTYTGSLTTPPCSQGLKWIVLKGKVNVSASQVAAFSARHGQNNRPLQAIGNRIVLEKK